MQTKSYKIEMTIDGEYYLAYSPMTWKEWINSDSNTLGLKVTDNGYIDLREGSVIPPTIDHLNPEMYGKLWGFVSPDDIINEPTFYSLADGTTLYWQSHSGGGGSN